MSDKNTELGTEKTADTPGSEPVAVPSPPDDGKRDVDEWAERLGYADGIEKHILAGAKIHMHWVKEDRLTEDEFKSGIENFLKQPWGGPAAMES